VSGLISGLLFRFKLRLLGHDLLGLTSFQSATGSTQLQLLLHWSAALALDALLLA